MREGIMAVGASGLMERLIEAGTDYIDENGHETLSMRKLADSLGVSSGAPYKHFPDRKAFLAVIAVRSLDEILAGGARAADSQVDPVCKLRLMADVMLNYAIRHPRRYDLIYSGELKVPEIEEAYDRGFSTVDAIFMQIFPDEGDEAAAARTFAYWSTLFGFATNLNRSLLTEKIRSSASKELLREMAIRHAIGDVDSTETTRRLQSIP